MKSKENIEADQWSAFEWAGTEIPVKEMVQTMHQEAPWLARFGAVFGGVIGLISAGNYAVSRKVYRLLFIWYSTKMEAY